jgi:beta-glucanase (GH16 family)
MSGEIIVESDRSARKTTSRLGSRLAFILALGFMQVSSEAQSHLRFSGQKANWALTWSDEFEGSSGSKPDPARWVVESGGGGWGNNELEYYTDRRQNIRQQDGNLVIEALKEKFVGPNGVHRDYTSARLKTEGRFAQQYGRFEARIKVPNGKGLWPAFWMLGDNFSSADWPACGEIDIMEKGGSEPSTISGSMHGPGYSAGNALTGIYTPPDAHFADDFHVFAVEWEARSVRFFVDGKLYATKVPADLPPGKPWVFDHPFFIVLNLAVGGKYPGNPNNSTVFPQQMLVDYVRVYSRK